MFHSKCVVILLKPWAYKTVYRRVEDKMAQWSRVECAFGSVPHTNELYNQLSDFAQILEQDLLIQDVTPILSGEN